MTNTSTQTVLSAHNCGRYDDLGYLADLAKQINKEGIVRNLIIETTYLGPTETKGSRIKAKVLGTNFSNTIGLDHSLSTDTAHLKAVLACLALWFEGEQLVPAGVTDTDKGFLFTFNHC